MYYSRKDSPKEQLRGEFPECQCPTIWTPGMLITRAFPEHEFYERSLDHSPCNQIIARGSVFMYSLHTVVAYCPG